MDALHLTLSRERPCPPPRTPPTSHPSPGPRRAPTSQGGLPSSPHGPELPRPLSHANHAPRTRGGPHPSPTPTPGPSPAPPSLPQPLQARPLFVLTPGLSFPLTPEVGYPQSRPVGLSPSPPCLRRCPPAALGHSVGTPSSKVGMLTATPTLAQAPPLQAWAPPPPLHLNRCQSTRLTSAAPPPARGPALPPGFVLAPHGHAPLPQFLRGPRPSGQAPPPASGPAPPEAPPTHSEAPSLVGDGPSAMAGLMVSAGSTGFLRASIGAPRPAAAPQPGPIGGGAARARGCGLGRAGGGRRPSRGEQAAAAGAERSRRRGAAAGRPGSRGRPRDRGPGSRENLPREAPPPSQGACALRRPGAGRRKDGGGGRCATSAACAGGRLPRSTAHASQARGGLRGADGQAARGARPGRGLGVRRPCWSLPDPERASGQRPSRQACPDSVFFPCTWPRSHCEAEASPLPQTPHPRRCPRTPVCLSVF